MKEQTQIRARRFIENRDKIKSVMSWDGGLIQLACAGVYTAKDEVVVEKILKSCKDLMKEKVGAFSYFRGTARSPIASMLAISENPSQMLANGLKVYELLKRDFCSSTYLPIAAMIITEMAKPYDYERIAERTRRIYKCMKAEHPFLTSTEDSAFCALLALSDKSDEVLIRDMEDCYHLLKEHFSSSNAVQSLSHVLALCDETPKLKCQKTIELYEKLKTLGYRYGTYYELPTLGVLAVSGGNLDEIAREMAEVDQWLSKQKGFGLFSGISKKQRLMYAGIIVQKEYMKEDTMQTAAIGGTISMVIAQEAAMCAAIAASAAVANASSSS